MSERFDPIMESFDHLPGDYRGEVYAAELIKGGMSFESIYFKLMGIFRRPVSKDMEALGIDYKEQGTPQLVVELNREGLYDMLPEGIFHFRKNRLPNKNKETVLDDIRQSRQEELYARRFFGPFENEFFHRRLQLELKEQALSDYGTVENKRELFSSLFGDPDPLTDWQVVALLHLLPLVYKIRGDVQKMEQCLNLLTRSQISLSADVTCKTVVIDDPVPGVGDMLLGVNAVAGNSFRYTVPHYTIRVVDLLNADIPSFFEGGSNRFIIDYIVPFMLPVDASYEISLEVAAPERRGRLSGDDGDLYLNINSFL